MAAGDREGEETENRRRAAWPSLTTQEGINWQMLPQAGEWYEDHFGLRQELVTGNALLRAKLFRVSSVPSVICGTDGWLYYKDSLDDYLGIHLMSERGLFNLAHTLGMLQSYLEGRGVRFVLAIAPNKNSLYDSHMPYYARHGTGAAGNLARLQPYLDQEGVNRTDLAGLLGEQPDVLYHVGDSHWNNLGAALACDAVLDAAGKDHVLHGQEEYEIKKDFYGDLDRMLFPLAMKPEEEIYFRKPFTFSYVGEVESTFDPKIETVNPGREGSLVMYRDSFGNAMLPFLADEFGSAWFTRAVPWQISDVIQRKADTVIAERAERFLPEMAENAPVLPAPRVKPDPSMQRVDAADLLQVEVSSMGELTKIGGQIAGDVLGDQAQIYVQTGEAVYEAFPVCVKESDVSAPAEETTDGTEAGNGQEDNGFVMYLPGQEELTAEDLTVYVREQPVTEAKG